jgi:protein-S-isoprenylcysteine O-methyltransferase Ste14
MSSEARHLGAVLVLPFTVAVLVPALLVSGSGAELAWGAIPGAAFVAVGLVLVVRTVALFARVGEGTLAPWDPTTRLVVVGPYRYVRNPMISGVLAILVGETLAFWSGALLVWTSVVFVLNAIYMPLVEEPGLRSRFGADYDRYCENVRRWVPRLRPWTG